MAQFIKKTYNKYEEKTTIEGAPCLMAKQGKIQWFFNLRRITTQEFDDVVVDIHRYSPEWFFLRDGYLFFNLDGKTNIRLDPHESYSDVGTQQGSFENQSTVITEESCYYELTNEELKEICETNHLDIQVTGEAMEKQMDGELFRLYSQAFYNAVIDNSRYIGSLNAYRRRVKKIEWTRNWVWLRFAIGSVLSGFVVAVLFMSLLYEGDISNANVVLFVGSISVAIYFIARYLYRR